MSDEPRVPHSIIFFPNGHTAVCDKNGHQIGKYQRKHKESIEALKADGYHWGNLEVTGYPNEQ